MRDLEGIVGGVAPYTLAGKEIQAICESRNISHAEELETSLVLYLDQILADPAKCVKEKGFPISKCHWRSLIDAPPLSFVDRWSQISETGKRLIYVGTEGLFSVAQLFSKYVCIPKAGR